MKKLNLLAPCAIGVILGMGSCTPSNSSSQLDSVVAEDTTILSEIAGDTAGADATPLDTLPPFEYREFSKSKGENKLDMEYPVAGNKPLVDAIRRWISEELGNTYKGDLDNGEKFFNFYASQLGNDPDLAEDGGYVQDEFEVEYKNSRIVTYEHTSFIYEGGAHGTGGQYGTTFLQADGSIFNKECITSYKDIHSLIVEGLKTYFKVQSDAQLLEKLPDRNSISEIPSPALAPWIDEKGVTFAYTPYEIAPYSAGSPKFTIPIDKIRPYLTQQGLRFIQ